MNHDLFCCCYFETEINHLRKPTFYKNHNMLKFRNYLAQIMFVSRIGDTNLLEQAFVSKKFNTMYILITLFILLYVRFSSVCLSLNVYIDICALKPPVDGLIFISLKCLFCSVDCIAEDHIHTDTPTCNIEEPQQKYRL